MSTGEMAYLALVIASMVSFALTLAWALYIHLPATNAHADAPAAGLPAF